MKAGQKVELLVAVKSSVPRTVAGVVEGGMPDADGDMRYTVRCVDGRLFNNVHVASLLVIVADAANDATVRQ